MWDTCTTILAGTVVDGEGSIYLEEADDSNPSVSSPLKHTETGDMENGG